MKRRFLFLVLTSCFLALTVVGCDFKLKTASLYTGVTLSYAQVGPSSGPALIFLHGYTDSWFSWSRVLARLPPNIRAYSLSQRGHGDSDKPTCCYSQADFANDVAAFMDAKDLPSAIIVGHSMGSLVAHKFAVSYPERVDKLVLVGSAPTMAGNEGFQGFLDYITAEPDVVNDPAFVRDFQLSTIYTGEGAGTIPDDFLETVIDESLKVEPYTWQGALQGLLDEDHTAELSSISCPTLILWGDKDGVFFEEDQTALVNAIPDATLNVYENTGHAVHWERPGAVTADLLSFIAD